MGSLPLDTPTAGSFAIGPKSHEEWSNPGSSANLLVELTQQCIAQIKDGYCDAVCGNCSYVIPPLTTWLPAGWTQWNFGEGEITGQDLQFTITECDVRNPECRATRYVRTDPDAKPYPRVSYSLPDLLTPDALVGGGYKDPFTHCLPPAGTQALTSFVTNVGGNFRLITGLYGHNSNTDAEAEFLAFVACGEDPSRFENLAVCSICDPEADPQERHQSPCLDETNTATSMWDRLTGWNWHNADGDDDLGKHPSGRNPVPICRTNKQPVYGM
jgi:hypothetical protein